MDSVFEFPEGLFRFFTVMDKSEPVVLRIPVAQKIEDVIDHLDFEATDYWISSKTEVEEWHYEYNHSSLNPNTLH